MKIFTNLFLVGLFMVGVSACSNENGQVPHGTLPGTDNVYMALNLSFPQSRSQTDGTGSSNSNAVPDIEVGTKEENKVENMKIYLVDSDNGQLLGTGYAVPTSDKNTLVGGNGSYVAKFDGQDLKDHAGKNAKVYVVCNNDVNVPEIFDKDETFNIPNFLNNVGGNASASWKPDLFIMSNAEQSKITLPKAVDMTYKYSNPTTPFKLGVVKVERTAARFDYKAINDDNLYKLNGGLNVQLTDMGVLNVSQEEYVFRHVGDENGNVKDICITEAAGNYVITPYWVQHNALVYYNDRDAQFKDKNSIKYIDLTNGKLRENDNWNGTGGGYKPMAYSSEVTSTKRPKNKDVTAIVFRGKLVAGNGCPKNIENILTNNEVNEKLYAYGDKIYGTWDDVKTAAKKTDADVLLVAAYNKAEALANNATLTGEIAAQAGFTVYTKNDKTKAYDVYYYYVNRHNDTGNDKVEELDKPMRYGVVRNNVYKLHVKNIKKYGHPFEPKGDPDPYKPDEKVDPENIYFEVGVKVLPWTVRVNDIEF